ncbi:MAG: hypothetical protein ACRDXD_11270, partial [Acidimicrobiia bacterium]
ASCCRIATFQEFHQPMAVVFQGRVLGFDNPEGNSNPGIKLHIAHVDNNNNYVVTLNTEKNCAGEVDPAVSCLSIAKEVGHSYTRLASRPYPFRSDGTIYAWKVLWNHDRLEIYHRKAANPFDRSHDELVLRGPEDTTFESGAVGLYLDGVLTRFYAFHVWQGEPLTRAG